MTRTYLSERTRLWPMVTVLLIVVAAAGLAVDGVVHLDLASTYAPVRTSVLSEADLFRAQGVVAVVAALLLIGRPRRYSTVIAAVVAGSALAVLLVYRYYDVGRLGPIPSMYEPVWYGEKTLAAIAEGAALVAAVVLVTVLTGRSASTGPHIGAAAASHGADQPIR